MRDDDQKRVEPFDDRLGPDDILAKAIERLPEAQPTRDLWPGVLTRISTRQRYVSITWAQLALAASLLMAVSVSLTWLVAKQPVAVPSGQERIVRAESEPLGSTSGDVLQANFADAEYDAAVSDLEKILRDERDRLDPRTVMVIERNLETIDNAIRQARAALDRDPANTYLNSHLADARRRKLELLRRATTLAPTGGD
jgi:hypothetical protein